MDKIWIGDFRCKALQSVQTSRGQFIIDDFAQHSWLATDVLYKLENIAPTDCDIFIMLGLADCINSCIWPTLKISEIAIKYSNSINALMERYPKCIFYFVTVGPVDMDYSSSFIKNGIISASALNNKIEDFNQTIKNTCKATIIDC